MLALLEDKHAHTFDFLVIHAHTTTTGTHARTPWLTAEDHVWVDGPESSLNGRVLLLTESGYQQACK